MAQAIPLVLAVVSTAATVYSTVQSGRAEEKAEKRIERQQMAAAEQARKAAAQRAEDEKKRHQAIIATQEARYTASGLTMEGTPLLVKMESLKESEEQIRRILEGGEVEYMTGAELAKAAGERGKAAAQSGYIGALGQAASGAYKTGRTFDWW